MTWLASACDLCCDLSRFIQSVIGFFVSSAATGVAFKAKHEINMRLREVTAHTGVVSFFSHIFTMSFSFMYIVNFMVIIYTLLGCPCIRYALFKETDTMSPKWRAIQCCLGPLCATFWQILVSLTLFLQISMSYAYLLGSVILGMVASACHGGHAVLGAFQHLMHRIHGSPQVQQGSTISGVLKTDMASKCNAIHNIDETAMRCFWGCTLSVVSQVLMLMVVSEEKGRIEGTMAEGTQKTIRDQVNEEERRVVAGMPSLRRGKKSKSKSQRRDDSDSDSYSGSSSSSSDDSPPKGKTTPYTGGGRNYRLPGGRR